MKDVTRKTTKYQLTPELLEKLAEANLLIARLHVLFDQRALAKDLGVRQQTINARVRKIKERKNNG